MFQGEGKRRATGESVIQTGVRFVRKGHEATGDAPSDEDPSVHLRAVLDVVPTAILVADGDRRHVDCNAAACEMLGVEREEMLGRKVDEIVDHPTSDVEAAWQRLQEQGELRTEWTLVRPDGRRVEAELDARAGLAAGLHVVVLRETTERRRLAAQIVQAERMEAAGQLAGGIAHDFNNLLTVIVGHGESALERVEDEEVREDLQQLLKASLRAASLTHQLLAFGRRQVLALEILDLGEILRDLGPLLQRLVGEGVKVEVDADTEIRPIRADRAQLEQVLVNLAANARDAMPAGGTLRVAIREAPSAGGGRACVLLEVSDDGEGMDEHTREHAFEPFFTTKEVGRGTGLGLSSVHGTLQQLDGEIRLESEPGRGTRFEILLPRAEHAPRPERVRAAAEAPAGSGECVLLVEDDPLVRASVRSTLERCGYRVCPSASGEEALERLEEGADEVDLVVTDAVMPGIGGGDLAREVGRRWPRIKVLVISGHADDALVRQGLSPGGPAFLKKPFTSAVLAARLRELLDSGS